MNFAICDDEPVCVDEITDYIKQAALKYNKQCNIKICHSGEALLDLCQKERCDAVFLDISMPGIDGFETAKVLKKIRKNLHIIFVSSKEAAVFKSYEFGPLWFVPKSQMIMMPMALDELFRKIDEEANARTHTVVCIEPNKVIEIDFTATTYFKTVDHYIYHKFKDGSKSDSYRNKLDNIEQQLAKHWFVRIHNRYLVNCRMISTIETSSCILINGEKIPISRSKMTHTKEVFQNYLRSIR